MPYDTPSRYASPELLMAVLDHERAQGSPYVNGHACDMWALGVNLFQMLVGEEPFKPERWASKQHIYGDEKGHQAMICGMKRLTAAEWMVYSTALTVIERWVSVSSQLLHGRSLSLLLQVSLSCMM